jgi:hypothetical protein
MHETGRQTSLKLYHILKASYLNICNLTIMTSQLQTRSCCWRHNHIYLLHTPSPRLREHAPDIPHTHAVAGCTVFHTANQKQYNFMLQVHQISSSQRKSSHDNCDLCHTAVLASQQENEITNYMQQSLVEKLTVPQLVKKFPILWNRKFITAFTTARHLSVFPANHPGPRLPTNCLRVRFNIILPPTPGSCKWFFPSGFPVCHFPPPSTCHVFRPSHRTFTSHVTLFFTAQTRFKIGGLYSENITRNFIR